jgi:hypothetical protein
MTSMHKVVNEYDESKLKSVLRLWRVENAPVLARTIVEAREVQPLRPR